jgi:hypothetical protein
MLALILIIQILFWMFFTHLKSRFLLPAAVPLTLGFVCGVCALAERIRQQNERQVLSREVMIAIGLVVWSMWTVLVYRGERNGAPAALVGGAGILSGDDLDPETRRAQAEVIPPAVTVNYGLSPDSKVLLVGDAKPLYYRDKVAYQTTWDRGPLSKLMREHPGDPSRWLAGLREKGFTHLLVDESMLLRWERTGWNDPLITRDRVLDFAQPFATVEHQYPGNVTLYRLNPG